MPPPKGRPTKPRRNPRFAESPIKTPAKPQRMRRRLPQPRTIRGSRSRRPPASQRPLRKKAPHRISKTPNRRKSEATDAGAARATPHRMIPTKPKVMIPPENPPPPPLRLATTTAKNPRRATSAQRRSPAGNSILKRSARTLGRSIWPKSARKVSLSSAITTPVNSPAAASASRRYS